MELRYGSGSEELLLRIVLTEVYRLAMVRSEVGDPALSLRVEWVIPSVLIGCLSPNLGSIHVVGPSGTEVGRNGEPFC